MTDPYLLGYSLLMISEPIVRIETRKIRESHAILLMYPILHSTLCWIAAAIALTKAGLLSSRSLDKKMSFVPMCNTTALGY